METLVHFIDNLLYILIYGFSSLFILVFMLEIQAAFVNYMPGNTAPNYIQSFSHQLLPVIEKNE
ncbi:hypothetical protein [Mastigocladopsis repens]|uniref:hypothetical protein n=1 Tax=Mastigocladopsis repens TaxID=221287 RepID=UPI0003015E25|nr:hypothetical protein [Mastigocladopsis repens]